MSLNYDFRKIKNQETVCYQELRAEQLPPDKTLEGMVSESQYHMGCAWYYPKGGDDKPDKTRIQRLHPVTNDLIWATLALNLGRITKENIDEFWVRYKVYQQLAGPTLNKRNDKGEWVECSATKEEIEAHIGLWTNVSEESWTYFLAAMGERARQRFLPAGSSGGRKSSWIGSPSQALEDALELLKKAEDSVRNFSTDEEYEVLVVSGEKDLRSAIQFTEQAQSAFEEAELGEEGGEE